MDPLTSRPAAPSSPPRPHRAGNNDPFASQREPNDNPFSPTPLTYSNDSLPARRTSEPNADPTVPLSQRDRRLSKEWDASKVPPSRFQKLEGSIYATPASRDGHVDRNKLVQTLEKIKSMTKEGKK